MWRPFLRGTVAQATKGKAPPFFKGPRGSGTVFPDDCWKGRASGTGEGSHPFPHLLAVCWQYESPNEQGMPSEDVVARMSQLEDLLEEAFEGARQAFLTVIVTG